MMLVEEIRRTLNLLNEQSLLEDPVNQILRGVVGGKELLTHLFKEKTPVNVPLGWAQQQEYPTIHHDADFVKVQPDQLFKRFNAAIAIVTGDRGCMCITPGSSNGYTIFGYSSASPDEPVKFFKKFGLRQSIQLWMSRWDVESYIGQIQNCYRSDVRHPRGPYFRRGEWEWTSHIAINIVKKMAVYLNKIYLTKLSIIRNKIHDAVDKDNYAIADQLSMRSQELSQWIIWLQNPTPSNENYSDKVVKIMSKAFARSGYGFDERTKFFVTRIEYDKAFKKFLKNAQASQGYELKLILDEFRADEDKA